MTRTLKFPRAKPYKLTASQVRTLVRHRDGYRCTECGMTSKEHYKKYKKALDVHRLVPGSRYTIKGCVTVCRKCHGPKPRSPRGTGVRQRSFIAMAPDIHEQLVILAKKHNRPLNREVENILIEHLRANGLWPPADEA